MYFEVLYNQKYILTTCTTLAARHPEAHQRLPGRAPKSKIEWGASGKLCPSKCNRAKAVPTSAPHRRVTCKVELNPQTRRPRDRHRKAYPSCCCPSIDPPPPSFSSAKPLSPESSFPIQKDSRPSPPPMPSYSASKESCSSGTDSGCCC